MKHLSIQSIAHPDKPAKNLNGWVKYHKFVNKIIVSGKSKCNLFTPKAI